MVVRNDLCVRRDWIPFLHDSHTDHFHRTTAARRRSRAPPSRARMVRAAAGRGSALRTLLCRQPRIVGFGLFGVPGVPRTDPQAGKQPSSGTNCPVPGIRTTRDCPRTLMPMAGRLPHQGRYLGERKQLPSRRGCPGATAGD